MSQRSVWYVVDRLASDSDVRDRFVLDPFSTIAELHALGLSLTPAEIDGFIQSDTRCWSREESPVPRPVH